MKQLMMALLLIRVPMALAQLAPPPNPTMWTLAGPTRTVWPPGFFVSETSGRIRSVVVDAGGTVYVGAGGGGVWKRVGSSWVPLTDQQQTLVTGSLALDPSDPNTLYVGTGEIASLPGWYGMGILKSSDAGATWTHIIGPFLRELGNAYTPFLGQVEGGARIPSLAVSPTDRNVLLAGVSVRTYDKRTSGVYRSADGGLNWTPVLTGDTGNSVVFDPADGSVAYAALGSTIPTLSSGVYKSTDAGLHWSQLTGTAPDLLPSANTGNTVLAISRTDPSTLYAGIPDNGSYGHLIGLFKTTDGGARWSRVASAPDYCAPFCTSFNTIAVHPTNPDIVLVGGSVRPVHRTLDGGESWDEISGDRPDRLHVDVSAFTFTADGSTVYVATDGGVAFSTTFAAASVGWTHINDNLAITQFYGGFDVDPGDENHAFVGTQDNGFQLFTGNLQWGIVAEGEGANIIYDAGHHTAYLPGWTMPSIAPDRYGGVSTRTGISTTERQRQFPPFAVNRASMATQYTGTTRVYQTTNAQLLWTPISPVLGGEYGEVSSVAVADHNPNIVCAGTSDGHVWCTANAGAGAASTWTDYSAGLPRRYVSQVTIHHFKEYIIGVAFSGIAGLAGDPGGHVFFSSSGGARWTDISGNLPNTPVNEVVIDAFDGEEPMYAATDEGVFLTRDQGVTWAPVATGLPRAKVTGLFLHAPSRTLYAGTFGRSMWRLSVPVTSGVTGPAITMNPWRMRFSAHFGGASPPPQPLSVMNAGSPVFGSTTLNWSATASTAFGGAWLGAAPTAGTNNATVNVSVDTRGLPLGLYNGVVRVEGPATNTPQDLVVMLEIVDEPPMAVAGRDIVADADSPAGAIVKLNGLGSSDPDKDPLKYAWTGPFGQAFGATPSVKIPVGPFGVLLTVADPAGLTSSDKLQVTVRSPAQMTSGLIDAAWNAGFQDGINLLESALKQIEDGKTTPACNKIEAFLKQTAAQSGKKLTTQRAEKFTLSARGILRALGCT